MELEEEYKKDIVVILEGGAVQNVIIPKDLPIRVVVKDYDDDPRRKRERRQKRR